jgi:hypothetical protein
MSWCSVTVPIREQLPEDGQVGPKHVAIDVILMLFLNKREIVNKV